MTEPLDNILGNGSDAAPEPEHVETEPTPSPQPAAASSAPAGQDDDDAEPQAIDHGGQKLVPKAALDAQRGKVKRYTEQVQSFEKKIEDQNKAWEHRFNQVFGLIQQQRQPAQPAQPQPAAAAPDFFENPEAAINAAITAALDKHVGPIAKHVSTMSETNSRRFAVSEHGQDTVNGAYQAMEQKLATDPNGMGDYRRIMASADPWGELVKWHKRESAVAEIGLDPAAYREKLKADILAELKGSPEGQQQQAPAGQQQPRAAAAPVMPSNLAGARNVGTRSGPAYAGPAPLSDIFDRRNAALTRAN